jgi:hypothetical protein
MPSNGSGYGTDYWGVGPWGIEPTTGVFSIEDVFANSERTVRVTFTEPARVGTAFRTGAALNLSNWSISVVGATTNLRLIAVREVEGSGGRQFELYCLEKFPDVFHTLQVACPNIVSAAGASMVAPTTASCAAAQVPAASKQINRVNFVDIRNRQAAPDDVSGILAVQAGGDYASDSGDDLLYKMIVRRLIARPGEFTHIPRDRFGVGFRVQEPTPLSDVPALVAEIERQIRQEPDVDTVSARVDIDPDGIVYVTVSARRISTGNQIQVRSRIPDAVVSL